MLLIEQIDLHLPTGAGRIVSMCQHRDKVLLATEYCLYELQDDGIGGYSAVQRLIHRINELESKDKS
jgi:hypothetical protein